MSNSHYEQLHPIFTNLNKFEVYSVFELLTQRKYKPGDTIIETESEGNSFYIILEGLVNVTLPLGDSEKHVADLHQGNFIGDIAYFAGVARSANVTAKNEVTVGEISRADFSQYLKDHPETGVKMLYTISQELAKRLVVSNYDLAFEQERHIAAEKGLEAKLAQ